jgi:hypothetical protein
MGSDSGCFDGSKVSRMNAGNMRVGFSKAPDFAGLSRLS